MAMKPKAPKPMSFGKDKLGNSKPVPLATRSTKPAPARSKKPSMAATAKAKPSELSFAQRSAAAEAELRKLMKAGAVKDLNKARDMIAKKYGIRPNGMTN